MIILSSEKSGWFKAQAGTDPAALEVMLQAMKARGVKVHDTGGNPEKRLFRIN